MNHKSKLKLLGSIRFIVKLSLQQLTEIKGCCPLHFVSDLQMFPENSIKSGFYSNLCSSTIKSPFYHCSPMTIHSSNILLNSKEQNAKLYAGSQAMEIYMLLMQFPCIIFKEILDLNDVPFYSFTLHWKSEPSYFMQPEASVGSPCSSSSTIAKQCPLVLE